jgi:hypothetical protein
MHLEGLNVRKLLASIAFVSSAVASQAAFIVIDDFVDGHFAYELGAGNPTSYTEVHTGIGQLNATRTITGRIDPESGSGTHVHQSIFKGRFQVQNNQGVRSFVNMDYRFAATDFTAAPILRWHFFVNNEVLPQFDITVYDAMGRAATRIGTLPGTLTPSTFVFDIRNFNWQSGFDLGSVSRINLDIRTDYSHGFDMRRFDTIPGPAAALAFTVGLLARRRKNRS